jgi:spore germination protein KC
MKRRLLTLLLSTALILTLSGCWDRQELNELGISVAMGIDKVGSQYQVSVQVVQPGAVAEKKGGGEGSPVTLYEAKADTIFEAVRKMTTESSRKIYSAHLRVVVLGENLAREGIGKAMDFLSRDYEFRTDFYILVAKGTTAKNVLSTLTPLEKIPAIKLYRSIEASEKVWAPTAGVTLEVLITNMVNKGKQPVLSGVEVTGDIVTGGTKKNLEAIQPAAKLQNAGLSVFQKDKLIGWLTEADSKGYNYILNHIKSTVGHIACPQGGTIAFEVTKSKAVIKGSVRNLEPQINIKLSVEQNVGEVACQIDLTKVETLKNLEKRAQQKLQLIINHAIHAVQSEYKVDIFGFGEAIHRADPKAWKSLKKDWDKHFADLNVNVQVKVKIKQVGTITNSFLEKVKE